MYKLLCLVLFTLLLVDATYARSGGGIPKYLSHSVTSSGYGPARIGMTVKKASTALGIKLLVSGSDNKNCHFVTPEDKDSGLSFMVQKGVITRIDVANANIKTLNGLKVGSTEAHVKSRYGKSLRTEQHKTGSDDDKYYIARVSSKNEILFEIIKGRVATFRAGLAGAIGQLEGCP